MQRFHGVVVITSALHAEGREFDPRWNLIFFIWSELLKAAEVKIPFHA